LIRVLTISFVLLAPSSFLLGCSGTDANRGEIEGQVTLDGKPLVSGSIQFAPIEGTRGVVTAGSIENGRYKLSNKIGPAVGWNRVEICSARKTGKMIQKAMAPPGVMMEEWTPIVPPKFNNDSTLKVNITPGENNADFALESK
jgi:hypothetical protein